MYKQMIQWLGIDTHNGHEETQTDVVEQPDLSEVYYWLEQGKKVDAIKAYRNATGVGLKEAKAFVEELQECL
jgi:ribosomal protein L7/L12